MEARIRAALTGLAVVGFVLASVVGIVELSSAQPPVGLAAPTSLCVAEVKGIALVFLGSVVVLEPAKGILRRRERVDRLLRREHNFSPGLRLALCAGVALGTAVFAFWSVADILGGYSGYGYSFRVHPILGTIYADFVSRIPFISGLDKGTQASIFFAIACLCLIALRLKRGLGTALKDTLTLFAAPLLILLELGVWYYAPQDMTWHVTDFLWLGGTADGGYRSGDLSGSYVFSNWLVLFLCIFLVCSRIPRVASVSRTLWRKESPVTQLQAD